MPRDQASARGKTRNRAGVLSALLSFGRGTGGSGRAHDAAGGRKRVLPTHVRTEDDGAAAAGTFADRGGDIMIGCYDFCGHYEWTFAWLEREGGHELVRAY